MLPIVSVILPVYNTQNYIKECIESILSQSFKCFELIIVDDCSTDLTLKKIEEFIDSRIIVIKKESNTGITDSLNLGIEISRGKYIARMDGDDVCHVSRFEKQVEFLSNNLDVIVCGSWMKIINTDNIKKVKEFHNEIVAELLTNNPIIHPSVMFRSSILKLFRYDKLYEPAEDFELWSRLCFTGKFYNIQEVLLYYRKHNNNVSLTRGKSQRLSVMKSRYIFLCKFNPAIKDINQNSLQFFVNGNLEKGLVELKEIVHVIYLLKKSKITKEFDRKLNVQLNLLIKNYIKKNYLINICVLLFNWELIKMVILFKFFISTNGEKLYKGES